MHSALKPHTFPRNRRALGRHLRRGFTLLEMLVVVGIIVILVSILLPAIKHVRYASYAANTKNEISQISSACQRYFDTFNDYPGPLSNSDIESGYVPLPVSGHPNYLIFDTSRNVDIWLTAPLTIEPKDGGNHPISSSENCVLGLCGGLVNLTIAGNPQITYVNSPTSMFPNAGTVATTVSTLVGQGPLDLSIPMPQTATSGIATPKQIPPFLEPTSAILWSGGFANGTGSLRWADGADRFPNGSMIPVFIDQYPDPLPIIYVRARKGAQGIISGTQDYITPTVIETVPGSSPVANAYYNYDIREFSAYTNSLIGITDPNNPHLLEGVAGASDANLFWPVPSPPFLSTNRNNGALYLINTAIQPTNITTGATINQTGTARQKDGFVLIAAGPDRRYGTADDETNFGSVIP